MALLRPVRWPLSRPSTVAVLTIACALLSAVASADSRAGDDRATAQAILSVVAGDAKRAEVSREPLARARRALERATEARAGADHRHGSRLEAVAREWAETARDLARAAEAERQAEELERRAHDLEGKLVRARALLEETVARRGRAQEMLEQLGGANAGAPKSPPAPPAPKGKP